MTELIPASEQALTLYDALDKMGPQFDRVLCKAIPADRFLRICMTQLRRIPKLGECDKNSVLGALMTAAQMNLEPGVNGSCWLLPFRNKGQMEATFVIGYQGLLSLAWRSGMVRAVRAAVVYSDDAFEFQLGTAPFIKHVPACGTTDPKDIDYAYAVIETTQGGTMFDVMTREQVEKVRARSPSGGRATSPWTTDYGPMAMKTVLKRACKLAPSSTELARAVALDDLAEVGKPQNLADTIDVGDVTGTNGAPVVDTTATPAAEGNGDGPKYRHACGHLGQSEAGCNEIGCENGVPPDHKGGG